MYRSVPEINASYTAEALLISGTGTGLDVHVLGEMIGVSRSAGSVQRPMRCYRVIVEFITFPNVAANLVASGDNHFEPSGALATQVPSAATAAGTAMVRVFIGKGVPGGTAANHASDPATLGTAWFPKSPISQPAGYIPSTFPYPINAPLAENEALFAWATVRQGLDTAFAVTVRVDAQRPL